MDLSAEINVASLYRQTVYSHAYFHSKGMKRGHASLQVSLTMKAQLSVIMTDLEI